MAMYARGMSQRDIPDTICDICGFKLSAEQNFIAHLKRIYGAPSLKAGCVEFERFCRIRSKYPGAIAVRKRCFAYVEQLFDYPSAVRKIMYTTNSLLSSTNSIADFPYLQNLLDTAF